MSETSIEPIKILRIASGEEGNKRDQELILSDLARLTGLNMGDLSRLSKQDVETLIQSIQLISYQWPRLYFELEGDDNEEPCTRWIAWIYMGQSKEEYVKIIYPKMSRATIKKMAHK